jgi:hypothetical protein
MTAIAATLEEKYKSTTLHLSSADRTLASASSSDFTINLNSTMQNIRKIKIMSVEMPTAFYPINSTNNIFRIQTAVGTVTHTATVAPGYYSLSDFVSTFQAALNGATPSVGGTFTVSISSTTYKLTITHSATPFRIGNGTINYNTGFVQNTTDALVQPASGIITISTPDNIFITSNVLSKCINQSYVSGSNEKIIHKVVANTAFGDVIYDKGTYETTYTYPAGYSLSAIDIQLKYKNGTLVDMNGRDWSFSMVVYSSM